jgi:hypothetical protein
MMIWKEYFSCLNRLIKYFAIPFILLIPITVHAQNSLLPTDHSLLDLRLQTDVRPHLMTMNDISFLYLQEDDEQQEFPEPKSVMYKSMIIPGWGQVINRQIWKVPIIYALFAGVGYYNYTINEDYKGYRAAYYNQTRGEDTDYKFGETPDFIPDGLSSQQLRETRDNLRNQRDFSYIIMVMAYGLNVLDSYVYAHMRSFDVSDDLSANTVIGPGILDHGTPGVKIRVQLYNNK